MLHALPKDHQNQVLATVGLMPKRSRTVDLSLTSIVEKFYNRDDISRVSPNTRDCRTFINRTTGPKELKQMRHLMISLKEAYALFTGEFSAENENNNTNGESTRLKFSKNRNQSYGFRLMRYFTILFIAVRIE